MAVARGDAVVVTNDGSRIAADTLVAYTTDAPRPGGAPAAGRQGLGAGPRSEPEDPLAASGKLQKVDAFGNVSVRTRDRDRDAATAASTSRKPGSRGWRDMSGSPAARTS